MADATPDRTPETSLTPEQTAAELLIDAIRGDPKHPAMDPSHPRHEPAMDELLSFYRARFGTEPVTTIGPEPAPTETPERPALGADTALTWDEPVLAEVERAAREVNLPHHVGLGLQLVSDLARAPRVTLQEAEATLQRQWGAEFEDQLDAASEAWDRLAKVSPRAAESLTRSGLRHQPRFVMFMARLGERLRQR